VFINSGVAYLLISGLSFTAQNVAVKYAGSILLSWQFSFARFAIGGVGMIFLAKVLHHNLTGKHKAVLSLRGVFGTIGFTAQIASIQYLPLSEAIVLFFLFPVFSTMFSKVTTGEPVPISDWPLLASAFLGVFLIVGLGSSDLSFGLGHLFALTGALFSGLAVNLVRRLNSDNNPLTIYFYFCIIGLAMSLSVLLVREQPLVPSWRGLWFMLLTALLAMLGQLAMTKGYKTITGPRGGVILMSQVAFAGIYGVIFLGERLTWRLLVGGLLIVLSGTVLGLKKTPSKAR